MNDPRQIHCWVDSYAYVVERNSKHDYRPMYIGVWNAAFESNEDGIYYFSNKLDAMNWPERFQRLYGVKITKWLEHRAGKQKNFEFLKQLMKDKVKDRAVLVMVDIFWIPYSFQYQMKHTPHVIIINEWDQTKWHISDAYLGWEGTISNEEMEAAFYYENLSMGVMIDTSGLQSPEKVIIDSMMEEEFNSPPGLLVREVVKFLNGVHSQEDGRMSKLLFASMEQVGVISKRMGGYTFVIEYFAKDNQSEAEEGVKKVRELVRSWEILMLSIARLAVLGSRMDFSKITQKLSEVERLELDVKQELRRVYQLWKNHDTENETVNII